MTNRTLLVHDARMRAAWALLGLVTLGCRARPVEATHAASEVMIVGTEHAGHILQTGYPMSHLEALLRAYRPDLVLVETSPRRSPRSATRRDRSR